MSNSLDRKTKYINLLDEIFYTLLTRGYMNIARKN
jgi:hypothetical protein